MSFPPEQEETAHFLQRLAGRPPIETHVSAVYLAEEAALKLKKAVHLTFLDFSTLAARHRFLLRELEVNRLGAPELYRDVLPIRHAPDGALALGPGEGKTVDWVLRMARVPAENFFPAIVEAGGLTPSLLDALGDAVADYHARLAPRHGIDPVATMAAVVEGNFASARAAGLPEERIRAWLAGVTQALHVRRGWLAARAAAGFVRRAHGDLHLGNLCLWRGKPVPFDALEFDEMLAIIDLAYDLAFLLMDLDQHVGRAAANRVMNRYVARSGDAGLAGGLAPFLSIRAMVRAHVQGKREAGDAPLYLAAALDYLLPAPGLVLAIGGLQGTGKTTLARDLAPSLGSAPGALHLRSDEWRKRLHGLAPEERLPPSAYSDVANTRTNIALMAALRDAAATGQAVIVDATFLDPAQRVAAEREARAAGRPFLGIWLHAPLPLLEERVAARSGDASDAGVEVLRRSVAADPGPGDWLAVEATSRDAAVAAMRAATSAVVPAG